MTTTATASAPALQTLEIADREYRVGPLTTASIDVLKAWIGSNHPHPFQRLKARKQQILEQLGGPEYRALLSEAYAEADLWPPSPASEAGRRALFADPRGSAVFIRVALAQQGQDISETEALALFDAMDADSARRFIEAAFGVAPHAHAPTAE